MNLLDFMKERMVYVVSISVVTALDILLLWALSPLSSPVLSFFIGFLYIVGAVVPLTVEYIIKKSFYRNLISVFESLDKKNLIAQIITPPSFKEGIILYDIIKRSNKAMLEEINKYKYMQEEYREYIELWVHEIKTPISSSRLISQNNRNPAMDSLTEELKKIENLVEQVLFYSRSNNVEKDYIITKINLKNLCHDILKKNSKLFIQHNIKVTTQHLNVVVFSDAKWLEFILNQVLSNSVKYSKKPNAEVKISAQANTNSIVLSIEDNGTGIQSSELPRIFDKGFTGTNGRKNERSTGMGLFICKRLCDKLGFTISAKSELGIGTIISLVIPKSSMMDVR